MLTNKINGLIRKQAAVSFSFFRRHLWNDVKPVPPDPILGLVARYKVDPNPNAVNLAQGAYRDDNGKPFVLESIKEAERRVTAQLCEGKIDKEYLGVEGNPAFLEASARFAFGENSPSLATNTVASVQALSGTGALRLAAEALVRIAGIKQVWLSQPSWGNHAKIFQTAGLETRSYSYLDYKNGGVSLDLDAMMEDLATKVPTGSVVLLHACAHNPTGVDPTLSQWRKIADIFQSRQLTPLFDSAYQGYASGDADVDAAAIREFDARGIKSIVCQSYAKNMGLYGERVGALNIVTSSTEEKDAVLSQVKQIVIRPMYSSPPLHGARLATLILTDPELRQMWHKELATMSSRIALMRQQLVRALVKEQDSTTTGSADWKRDWSHITSQIGMFAFTGLSETHVNRLLDEHGVYLTKDGRMSLAGLRSADVDTVARGIVSVLKA